MAEPQKNPEEANPKLAKIEARPASLPAARGTSPDGKRHEEFIKAREALCIPRGLLPNPRDTGYKEAVLKARRANIDKSRIQENLKFFQEIPDKNAREAVREKRLAAAAATDLFDVQHGERAELSLMFLRDQNLEPTCGPISFTVDFAHNQKFEMGIGLASIFPPSVKKVEVTDTDSPPKKRIGERKIIDSRVGYYDDRGYIPIFSGFAVTILETIAPDSAAGKDQARAEEENTQRLRQEFTAVTKEETEGGGRIRLTSLLNDPNTPELLKNDFAAMQNLFYKNGIGWDESVWINGGAALQRLNGRGAAILGRERVMSMFRVLARSGDFLGMQVFGNYRAHLEDMNDIAVFTASMENSPENRDRFLLLVAENKSSMTGYTLLNFIRRFNDGDRGQSRVSPGTPEIKQQPRTSEARDYLQNLLAHSDPRGREIFNASSRTFEEIQPPQNLEKEIARLNNFGWAADSFATVVIARTQKMYLLHKNAAGAIDYSAQFRVSMGRRDRMGSNVSGSNGTPAGVMEWYAPRGQFETMDSQPIGQNMRPGHKDRGRAGITSRWLRTRGLESSNDNSDGRGIFFHGGGYMDGYRGGYEQSWVPRSRGCIVMSNADTMICWSYIRQNFLKGQKLLCDVVI